MKPAALGLALGLLLGACGETPQVQVSLVDDGSIKAFAQLKANGGDLYFRISFADADGSNKTIGFPDSCSLEPPDANCGYTYGNGNPSLDLNRVNEFSISTAVDGSYTIPVKAAITVKAITRKADKAYLACGAATVTNEGGAAASVQLSGSCPP